MKLLRLHSPPSTRASLIVIIKYIGINNLSIQCLLTPLKVIIILSMKCIITFTAKILDSLGIFNPLGGDGVFGCLPAPVENEAASLILQFSQGYVINHQNMINVFLFYPGIVLLLLPSKCPTSFSPSESAFSRVYKSKFHSLSPFTIPGELGTLLLEAT